MSPIQPPIQHNEMQATPAVEFTAPSSNKTAHFLLPDENGLRKAGERLRAGHLVAFPTETVYGLGANALNADAVLSIFQAKQRPLTDPLIVHVPSVQDALDLVDLTPEGRTLFECLASAFWPGPLTLISKAVPALPLTVSAGTGFVGLRFPSHPIAQALLHHAQVPVAAPSANRFGHVSPTCAQHVMDDLSTSDISILHDQSSNCCQVGIESTVIKLVPEAKQIIMFRRGGIPEQALQRVLEANQTTRLGGSCYEIIDVRQKAKEEDKVAQQAPGQLLTHYAPDVDTFLYQPDADEHLEITHEMLHKTVLIDFHGTLASWQAHVLQYKDLSSSGNIQEAAQRIFESLRWAENIPGAERVIVTDVLHVDDEHAAALHDRMFRAASGKTRAMHRST